MRPKMPPQTFEAGEWTDPPDADDVQAGVGEAMGALIAAVLPLLFALYAILTTGKVLGTRWKFLLVGGTAGAYGVALIGLGVVLARAPARAAIGRTLVVCGGFL